MNYCSLEEAWGDQFKDSRKKKKTKRLYTSKIPPHIYDKSYLEKGHDTHCKAEGKRNYTIKNKDKHGKSRSHKDIYRPKNPGRVSNINISYDNAKKEYKKYKKETKKSIKNKLSPMELVEENNYPPNFTDYGGIYQSANEEDSDYASYGGINSENDIELEGIPQGHDLSTSYGESEDDHEEIQRKMYDMQMAQSQEVQRKRNMLARQIDQQYTDINLGNTSPYPTDVESDYSEVEPFESEYSMLNNMIIEGFSDNENQENQENQENIEEDKEELRLQKIRDVERNTPSYESPIYTDNEEETIRNTIKNRNTKKNVEESNINKLNNKIQKLKKAKKNNKGNGNLLDKILNLGNSRNRNEESSDEETDSEDEEEDVKLSYIDKDDDIDYKLNTLNRNVNLLIRKMNDSQLFEDDSQDNIHDLILFILFGIFIIFVLDTIYRFGKNNSKK